MRILESQGGRAVVSRGLLVLLAVSAVAACDSRTPEDPDPKPAARFANITIRQINDSTIAYDLVAADTTPITMVVSVAERFTGETFGPFPYTYRATAETTLISPARYNVRVSDTLPSRPQNAWYRWGVVTWSTANRAMSHDGRWYSGSKAFTMSVPGIPDTMQHVGLDLIVAPRGPHPVRSVRAYVDSGSAAEQSLGPIGADSAILTSGEVSRDFHLWITGPMSNGPHSLTFVARDSLGEVATYRKNIVVAIPSRAYRIVPLVIEGAIDASANDINNAGTIALTAVSADSTTRAYRWENGSATALSGPGSSSADAINGRGDVAGFVGRARGTSGTGTSTDSLVVWRGTTRTALQQGYGYLRAMAIADDGTTLVLMATRYRGGTSIALPLVEALDMNNEGVSVGYRLDYFSEQAMGARPESFSVPLPYNVYSKPAYNHCCFATANFINDAGQIIGTYEEGFFIADGSTSSWTINPLGRGAVAGMSRGDKVLSRLTDGSIAVWTIKGPTTRVILDDPSWTIDVLRGVNDAGQIIAHGVNKATGQKAALLLDPR